MSRWVIMKRKIIAARISFSAFVYRSCSRATLAPCFRGRLTGLNNHFGIWSYAYDSKSTYPKEVRKFRLRESHKLVEDKSLFDGAVNQRIRRQ